jgi:Domain of unknown function DUF11
MSRNPTFRPALAFVPITLLVVGAMIPVGQASAEQLSPHTIVQDTDVVSAGVGGMNFRSGGTDGAGSITVTGVSGSVTQALLYWEGPTNSTDPDANASVTFAGQPVTGVNIGISGSNCWDPPFPDSLGYRADVTSLVPGDGIYALSNFTNNPSADVNGASLIVFFDDGVSANNVDVVVVDGNDSNFLNSNDPDGWDATIAGVTNFPGGGAASLELHVSDGQPGNDDALTLNGTQLEPAGAIFEGTSVGNAGSGENLWDVRSFDVSTFMTAGSNTLNLTTGQANDCIALVAASLTVPVGSTGTVSSADLSITKTMDVELLNTFVLAAQNAGPEAATTVSISDELGNGQLEEAQVCHVVTGNETCDDFPAGYDDFVGVIDVGTMSSGATEVYKIRVDTDLSLRDGPLSIPNTATIASDGASDPNTDNNAASLDVDVATVPDPPQINALAPANGRAALNFSQTDDGDGSPDGGSAITGYRVLAQTVSPSSSPCPSVLSSPSVVLTVGPTPNAADGSFSYFVPNLANFTKYCLAVVAVNAVGSSDRSNVEDVIPTDQADANFVPAAGNLTLTINPAGASATKTTKTTYTLTGSAADAGNIVTLAVIPQPPPGEFSCFATVDGGVCPGSKIVHSEPGLGNDIHLEIDQIDTTVSTRRTGTLRHVCFTYPCSSSTDPYFVYQDAPPAVLGPGCAVNGVYVIGSSFSAGLTATQAATYGIPCLVPAWSKSMLANRVLKVQELNNKTPSGNNDIQFQVWIAGDPKRGP